MITKEFLAALDATLNGISGIFLILGYLMIRNLRIRAHATFMIAALTTSAMFLVCYVYSYLRFDERSSHLQPGLLRTFYFVLLVSHVLLAIGVLPMVVVTVWHAAWRQFPQHRKIARPTFWIWLYVSVTGVIVYLMLYHLFPAMR